MDDREKLFVHEYIINGGKTCQAALAAGYSKTTAAHAYQWLDEKTKSNKNKSLPYKPYLREAIDAELKKIEDEKIADEIEIMQYLTAVMRKQTMSNVVVVEGVGEGISEARLMEKPPDEKEATKAAEILAKIHGMFTKNLNIDISPVVLEGYEDVPD